MSAITIVKENLNVRRSGKFPKELLELLHKKYSILPHVDELLCEPDISPFFPRYHPLKVLQICRTRR